MKTTGGALPDAGAGFPIADVHAVAGSCAVGPVPKNLAACAVKLCGATRPDDPRVHSFAKSLLSWGGGAARVAEPCDGERMRLLSHRPDGADG